MKPMNDWHTLMAFGLGVLKLSSNDFWSMTLQELLAATGNDAKDNVQSTSRDWLVRAMTLHPDKVQTQGNS